MSDEPSCNINFKLPLLSLIILRGAIIISVGWLLAAGYFAFYDHGTVEVPTKLNEWGDFAAGVFAPVAFLWLVVAVALQSTELREQRNELALTRDEFKHNRKVMEAQTEEARNQAKYIFEQTEMLKTAQLYADADRVFDTAVEHIATRLRQYIDSAWKLYRIEEQQDGSLSGTVLNIKKDMYDGDDDILVISTTVQVLRTRFRDLRKKYPDLRLWAEYGHDFQRVYRAIKVMSERITKLPPIFQEKANTLELVELQMHMDFIADCAGIKPFGAVPKGLTGRTQPSTAETAEGEDAEK